MKIKQQQRRLILQFRRISAKLKFLEQIQGNLSDQSKTACYEQQIQLRLQQLSILERLLTTLQKVSVKNQIQILVAS